MFLSRRLKNYFKSIVLIGVLTLFLWRLFYQEGLIAKPLAEELKLKTGVPVHSKEISIIIKKGQIHKQLAIDESSQKNPIYYSITNLGKWVIQPQVVINNLDWFTDKSIVDYALKGINQQKASNEELVLNLLSFVVNNRYHWKPALYETSYYYVENPVQYLNIWGYGLCSNSSRILIQLLSLAGFEARLVNLIDHVVGEVFYDGSWHALDADLEVYFRNVDEEIASAEEIADNYQLLDSPIWLRSLDNNTQELISKVLKKTYAKKPWRYTPVEKSMENKDYRDEIIYNLRPNEEIRFYYDFEGKYYWGYVDDRPPEFTNGILISESNGGLIQFKLPYPILTSYIYKPGLCQSEQKSRFSLNGLNWEKITDCRDDVLNLTNLFPIGNGSYPTEKYYLYLPFSLTDYQLLNQFQVSPKSIPRLNYGDNLIVTKNPLSSDIIIKFGYE